MEQSSTVINVNAGHCGSSKTRGPGEYSLTHLARESTRAQRRSLMVIKTKDGQKQVAEYFREMMQVPIPVISSGEKRGDKPLVQKQFDDEIKGGIPNLPFIVTHDAYTLLEIPARLRRRIDLYIDEPLENVLSVTKPLEIKRRAGIAYDLPGAARAPSETDDPYPIIRPGGNFLKTSVTKDLHDKLNRPNTRVRVPHGDWHMLCRKRVTDGEVRFFVELDPSILHGYNSVWVFGADLPNTLFGSWMQTGGIEMDVKVQFEPQDNATLHAMTPDAKHPVFNSKDFQDKHPEIREDLAACMARHKEPWLLWENADCEKKGYIPLGAPGQVVKMPGKPDGLNCYRGHSVVVAIAAMIPQPMKGFMRTVYGETDESIDEKFTFNPMHQAVARSCIRDGKPATMYAYDSRASAKMKRYFRNVEEGSWDAPRFRAVQRAPSMRRAAKGRRLPVRELKEIMDSLYENMGSRLAAQGSAKSRGKSPLRRGRSRETPRAESLTSGDPAGKRLGRLRLKMPPDARPESLGEVLELVASLLLDVTKHAGRGSPSRNSEPLNRLDPRLWDHSTGEDPCLTEFARQFLRTQAKEYKGSTRPLSRYDHIERVWRDPGGKEAIEGHVEALGKVVETTIDPAPLLTMLNRDTRPRPGDPRLSDKELVAIARILVQVGDDNIIKAVRNQNGKDYRVHERGMSLKTMPRLMRPIILPGAWEIDMCLCNASSLAALMREHDVAPARLDLDFENEPEDALNGLRRKFGGGRDRVKKMVNHVASGGCTGEQPGHQPHWDGWGWDLQYRLKDCKTAILDREAAEGKNLNENGALYRRLTWHEARKLECLRDHATEAGLEVVGDVYDAIYVREMDDRPRHELAEPFNRALKDRGLGGKARVRKLDDVEAAA